MRYVFTLTSGRTGTRTLSALLGANLPGARVHHERLGAAVRGTHTPSIPVLLSYNHFGYGPEVEDFWARKWADVAQSCAATWVETSHLLMKAGLIHALGGLAADADIHLVVLRRDRLSLLRSFMRLQDFRRMGNRLQWYLHERAPRNLVPLPDGLASSAEGMALWYILEVEARVELALRQVATDPRVKVHVLRTEHLGDPDRVYPLLSAIRPGLQRAQVVIPPRLNASRPTPADDADTRSLAVLVEQVKAFDAKTHLDSVLHTRPDPFAPIRLRPRRSAVSKGTPLRLIGSPGRSGSTLAVDLLGCHPQVSPVYETEVMPLVLKELIANRPMAETADAVLRTTARWLPVLTRLPSSKSSHEHFVHGPHHLRFSPDQFLRASAELGASLVRGVSVDAALATYMRSLFDAHAQLDGCTEWVNKVPTYLEVAPALLSVLLDAKLLITVRDPRDVALSVLAKPWGPSTIEEVMVWWKNNIRTGLQAKRLAPDRVCFIRFEDMVCNPVPTLDKMQTFLGLPVATDEILSRRAAEGIGLDPGRVGVWRARLTPAQAALLGGGLGEELDHFGYAPGR